MMRMVVVFCVVLAMAAGIALIGSQYSHEQWLAERALTNMRWSDEMHVKLVGHYYKEIGMAGQAFISEEKIEAIQLYLCEHGSPECPTRASGH